MEAIVKEPFPGVRDGEVHPVDLKTGDVISGDLARVAVAAGLAEKVKPKPAPPKKEGDVNPEDMTVDELKALAALKSIDLGEAKLKADIIAVIMAKLSEGGA